MPGNITSWAMHARKIIGGMPASPLFCCVPLVIFALVLLWLKLNLFHWVPLWNDEVMWYVQIDSVLQSGAPLGFMGYNETHAEVGTFGPWGGAIIYAMACFGKLFGWRYWSPVVMNASYMTVANVVFLLFARPKGNIALKLAALNCILFVNVQYMFTGMSECTRFSMSIVLVGMFCYLLEEENMSRKTYLAVLYAIAPVLLVFFSSCYIMFSFLFPVYGYVLFRHLNPKRCRYASFFILCCLVPAIVAFACLLVLNKTSSPYPGNTLQVYFSQTGLVALWNVFCKVVAENVKCASLGFVIGNATVKSCFVAGYLIFYYLLCVVVLFKLVLSAKKEKRISPLDFLVAYALVFFVSAFLLFYSTKSSWTYIRGLNVALVFGLYVVCVRNWRGVTYILCSLACMQFLPVVPVIRDNLTTRMQSRHECGGDHELFEKYAKVFADKLKLSKTDNKWDNTCAVYGTLFNFYCTVPSGFGLNYMLNNQPVTQPRYIVADRKTRRAFAGYRQTYSDEYFSIFEKLPL